MTKRQTWIVVLAFWIVSLLLIGAVWAAVRFWVLKDGPAPATPQAYNTATAQAVPTDAAPTIELTPVLGDSVAELSPPTSTPLPSSVETGQQVVKASPEPTTTPGAPEASAEPTASPEPTDTTAPTRTPRPTATPVPTSSPTPKVQGAGKPTDTPKAEVLRLNYKKMPDRSRKVVYTSNKTDETVAVFEPGGGAAAYSAAWSPGGEHVLTAASWKRSKFDFGERVRLDNRDGSGGYDILFVPSHDPGGAEKARDLGNAVWSPDGKTIAMWYVEGPNDGVFVLNSDGTGLRRMDNSQPGDWPRWWSVDGEWIVVINDNGGFFALDVAETQRVPWDSLEDVSLYDQQRYPWRVTKAPKCSRDQVVTTNSWWKCR